MRERYTKIEAKVAASYPNDRNVFLGSAATMAILLVSMKALPAFAVLPTIASAALAFATLTALAARWSDFKNRSSFLIDLAGASALVGAAAAILGRPTHIVETVVSFVW